ncbi:hypothetical protein Acsp05_17640 [Actinokineospora sp. NBRC 105648]|nr:hypothetical protein Acsp05_17640 [Actinokineospora sp. NBRC 105648]
MISASNQVATFDSSVNDVLTLLNGQIPILEPGSSTLPTIALRKGVFGGQVKSDAEIYLLSRESLLDDTRAVAVRITGSAGSVNTPTRLLSVVGASVNKLSADSVQAFSESVLPKLSTIAQTRTTITVGTFYTLTIIVSNSSSLTFIYTPVGTEPPVEAETLGP